MESPSFGAISVSDVLLGAARIESEDIRNVEGSMVKIRTALFEFIYMNRGCNIEMDELIFGVDGKIMQYYLLPFPYGRYNRQNARVGLMVETIE